MRIMNGIEEHVAARKLSGFTFVSAFQRLCSLATESTSFTDQKVQVDTTPCNFLNVIFSSQGFRERFSCTFGTVNFPKVGTLIQ